MLAYLKPEWSFPVILHVWSWQIPIHPVFDVLAYFVGFRFYLYLKKRTYSPQLAYEQSTTVLLGCIFGALIGAKLLAWTEEPSLYWSLRHTPEIWFSGKTIVGGLLGGWIGVALVKKILGIASSTGDLCVFPLILGMAIGRIGCFLTGLSDNTCGTASTLPWVVDYGDGIPRHPAQIYEILFLLTLGTIFAMNRKKFTIPGQQFRWFMIGYLAFRFCVDFIKPHEALVLGLCSIQWACLVALVVTVWSLNKISNRPLPQPAHV